MPDTRHADLTADINNSQTGDRLFPKLSTYALNWRDWYSADIYSLSVSVKA
jgi:hypothetical protein